MCQVEENTQQCPGPQNTIVHRRLLVQTKHPHHRQVQAIQDTGARAKIVQLFRESEIARVEHHAEDPRREAKVSKAQVVFPQRVRGRDGFAQHFHAVVVGEEVEERKDDGKGFLHAEEAVKGPFAMELEDGFAVWWVAGEALVGDDVLAGIVAFRRTVPEEEAVLQC